MVVLVVLSALGVDIGPLLAGAGVVGLAIGFGAQKQVSDVFFGFFYLLDDAFCVGESIQAGSVSGTAESITLRNGKPVLLSALGEWKKSLAKQLLNTVETIC